MMKHDGITAIRKELTAAIELTKCQQCGCLREALDNLARTLPTLGTAETDALAAEVAVWLARTLPAKYSCLGCEYCYGAVAQNAFAAAFPNVAQAPLACDFQVRAEWPLVVGEYSVLDRNGHVAVSTLGSTELAEELAGKKPQGLAIVGKTETENIGIDKIVKNVITNHTLRYLVVVGKDPAGHQSGQTLLALAQNGVDEKGRIIGSPGKRPVLRNVSTAEVNTFREQVQVIDLIGCEDSAEIVAKIEALSPKEAAPCG
jgi:tetrahydromethanopterin S-methyltransferase subunit A